MNTPSLVQVAKCASPSDSLWSMVGTTIYMSVIIKDHMSVVNNDQMSMITQDHTSVVTQNDMGMIINKR